LLIYRKALIEDYVEIRLDISFSHEALVFMKLKRTLMILGKWLKRIISFLLILLFAFVSTMVILGHVLTERLTSVTTYDNLIQQTGLAERGRGLLADFLVSYALSSGLANAAFLGDFPAQTWETVAQILLPVDWLENNLQEVTRSALDWLGNTEYQVPQFTIDLSPIIQALRGPQGALAVLPLLQDIPTCAPDVKEIVIMEGSLVSCLPGTQDITPIGRTIARSVANFILIEVSFTTLQQVGIVTPQTIQMMGEIRDGIHAVDLLLVVGFRLSLLILCFYAVLHSASSRALLAALPAPLFVAGSLSLALLGIFQAFLGLGLELSMTAFFPGLKPEAQALLVDLVRTASQGLKKQWLYGSLILLAAGLVLYLLKLSVEWARARRALKSEAHPEARPRIRKQYR